MILQGIFDEKVWKLKISWEKFFKIQEIDYTVLIVEILTQGIGV
jgi:hypothetical protein